MHEFRTRRRVEFVDTDMGGIVHFSRFMVFMETAEHLFLDALGFAADEQISDRGIAWPRVKVACEYRSPAHFGDVLDIELTVLRKGRSSITYGFRFGTDGRELAIGEVTAVCCELAPGRPPRSIPIPEALAARIDEAPRG